MSKDFVVQVGLVVEIDMIDLDIALSLLELDMAVGQVLVETMGLCAPMAGHQLFVEEMGLAAPMAGHQIFVEEKMGLVVLMVGHQIFVEEMGLVAALEGLGRWWVLHTAVSLLQVVAHMDMIALVVGVVDSPLGVVLYSSQSIANS